MNVQELITELQKYPADAQVGIEGYQAGTEDENRGYDVVCVEGWKNEDFQHGVILYGLLRQPD
jgi:hypothetical protein